MAFPLSLASILVITVLFLFYTGFGITRLVSFQRVRGEALLIVPSVGFSLIVTIAYWGGWLGWSSGLILTAVFAVATLGNLLAVLRYRSSPLQVWKHLPIYAVAFGAYAIAVAPILHNGTLAPIGTNGDQVWYTNVAASLAENSFPPPTPARQPALVQLALSFDFALPLGFSYLHAFVAQLAQRDAYETFSLVTASSLPLNVLAYTFVATCLFGTGSLGRLCVALLTAASPMLMWVHYNNYAPHAMSLSFVALASCMPILTFLEGRRHMPLASLLLSAAFVTYPPAFPILILCPIVLYVVLDAVRRWNTIVPGLQTLVQLFVLAAVLNLPGLFYGGKYFRDIAQVEWIKEGGDVDRYVSWTELYGFSHHRLPEPVNPLAFFPFWPLVLGFCAVSLTLYGVWGRKMTEKLAFTSLLIIYLPSILWLRYGLDYPYAFFKALTFFTFPAVTGLALGFERLLVARNATCGALQMVVALACLGLSLGTSGVNLVALAQRVMTVHLDFAPLLALRNIKGLIRETESIHIRDARDTPLLWMTYFLRDYELSLAHYTPYYFWRDWPFYQEAISAELVLVNKDSPVETPWAVETVYENSRYRILRKDPRILAYVDTQGGGVPLERGDMVKVEVFTDHLTLNGRNITLSRGMHGGEVLRIGALALDGSAVSLSTADKTEQLLLSQHLYTFDCPMARLPAEVRLTHVGESARFILHWLEITETHGEPDCRPVQADVFRRFRAEVIPNADVFAVSGWHAFEEGGWRWTDRVSLSVLRNPFKPIILSLAGFLPSRPAGMSPGKASILLNGQVLGELNRPGAFRQTYLISEQLLGSSAFGVLETSVESSFDPSTAGVSQDPWDLGIALTHLEIVDLALPADGFIDIGTRQARRYLGDGWSGDEQSEDSTFVWADAQESLLRVSLSQLSDFQVELRVIPFRYPSSPLQGLSVYVNERYLQDITLPNPDWRVYTVHVPQAFLALGLNTFRFVYRYTASPAQVLPGSRDTRTLAVAWDSLWLHSQ